MSSPSRRGLTAAGTALCALLTAGLCVAQPDGAGAPPDLVAFPPAPDVAPGWTVLLRLPAAGRERSVAERWARRGVAVFVQTPASPPTAANAGDWLPSAIAARRRALRWLAAGEASGAGPRVAEIAVGSAAAATLASSGEKNASTPDAIVWIDPPATLGELFFAGGLYRVAERGAVRAARTGVALDQLTIASDLDPTLGHPLDARYETAPRNLWLSGWFRPHARSTVALWRSRREANARPGAHELHLGAWTGGDDVSALDLAGGDALLDHAFEWVVGPTAEPEAGSGSVSETADADRRAEATGSSAGVVVPSPAAPPAVRYEHLRAQVSTAGPAERGWRSADEWPPACLRCSEQRWHLRAGGGLTTEPPGPEAPTSYRFDPSRPVFTIGGAHWSVDTLADGQVLEEYPIEPLEHGPLDQRRVGERPDYLRFRGEALARPLHLRGSPRVELWVASDAPDTAFVVQLVDVHPDGYQALLLETALATRHRDDPGPSELSYGVPERLDVELGPISATLPAGHRIALHVTSSSWPAYEVHPNTHWEDASAPPRPAFQTVYHDRQHASVLILPRTEEP